MSHHHFRGRLVQCQRRPSRPRAHAIVSGGHIKLVQKNIQVRVSWFNEIEAFFGEG